MKSFIAIILTVFISSNVLSQNLSGNSVSDKDYVNLINYYLKNDNKELIKYNFDSNSYRNKVTYLLPNGKFLTEQEIISFCGQDYFNSITHILSDELPYFHKNNLNEFCFIEKNKTIDKNRLITGCSITMASLTLFCISNSAINHRINNSSNPNEIADLNKAKYITGYICGAGALAGIIVSLTSIKTTIKINKNVQFDVNGALIQYSHKF